MLMHCSVHIKSMQFTLKWREWENFQSYFIEYRLKQQSMLFKVSKKQHHRRKRVSCIHSWWKFFVRLCVYEKFYCFFMGFNLNFSVVLSVKRTQRAFASENYFLLPLESLALLPGLSTHLSNRKNTQQWDREHATNCVINYMDINSNVHEHIGA